MAMTLVSTTTVPSGGAASIEFTNIPQTGKDLLLVMSARVSSTPGASWTQFGAFTLNGTNCSYRRLRGNGSTVSSSSANGFDAALTSAEATANTFGSLSLYISNYTQAINHSVSMDNVTEHNGTSAIQEIYALTKAFNANAVTSISAQMGGGDVFVQHSTASLYIVS